ncbi:MAG: flotillin family protein [Armatimonadota bacterium]
MMIALGIILGTLVFVGLLLLFNLRTLVYICEPNEVLIFSGRRRRVGNRSFGYRIVKGGMGFRRPIVERVDRLDLTNMVIDVSAHNAYSKGGVPLSVAGVANVKVAGHEPVLNNAIERFLGKSRIEIMQIAKATLEGSLRGVLATLTPEEVNEDRILFAEKLVQEVEHDMTALGLVVDTLKIQQVTDDVKYLDSIGRIKSAEIVREARIAEAIAQADAAVAAAENRLKEVEAQVKASIDVARAEAEKRLTDAITRRDAVVAEENAAVAAAVAQATAEVDVQTARVEQVRRRLEADVVAPAKAACEAAEAQAKADAAPIIQDGAARADALRILAKAWHAAGPNAREVFLVQKLDRIVEIITDAIATSKIEQITMIDTASGGGSAPMNALSLTEQIKQIFGVDVVEKLRSWEPPRRSVQAESRTSSPPPVEEDEVTPTDSRSAHEN